MNLSQYVFINERITLHASTAGKDFIFEGIVNKTKGGFVTIVLPDKLKDSPVCAIGIKIILKWTKDNKLYSLSTKIVQNESFPLVLLDGDGEVLECKPASPKIQGDTPLEQNLGKKHVEVSQSEKTPPHAPIFDYLRDLVNEIPQLYNLGPEEVNLLLQYVSYKSVKKGFPLFLEGDPGNSVFYIAKGAVDIVKESIEGNPIKLARFGKDKVLGEMALVDPAPRSATATVTEDAEFVILSHEKFESLLNDYPSIGIKIFKQISMALSQRIRFANGRLVDIVDQAKKKGITLEEIE